MRFGDGFVELRPATLGDADQLYAAVAESLEEIGRWMDWAHPGYSPDETAAFLEGAEAAWEAGEAYPMVILDDAGHVLGTVGINQIHPIHRYGNLGYWVRSSAAGRGVATRAVMLMAWFGLEELRLDRLEVVTAVENLASRRVAEKAGATFEGILRSRLQVGRGPVDAAMYSFTGTDLIRMADPRRWRVPSEP